MKGFYIELSRLKTMIAEVVWPTESYKLSSTKIIEFDDSDEGTFSLKYSNEHKSFVAEYATTDGTVEYPVSADPYVAITINVSIWANKIGPNNMESIGACLDATYANKDIKKDTECTHLQRTESVVPDVKFLEDMTLHDVEQVAHYLLKCIRSMIQTLNERNLPCKE